MTDNQTSMIENLYRAIRDLDRTLQYYLDLNYVPSGFKSGTQMDHKATIETAKAHMQTLEQYTRIGAPQ